MSASNHDPQAKNSFMNNSRKFFNLALLLIGTQVILSVVFFTDVLPNIAVILVGLLLFELGIFKLGPKLLPNQRKYHALRAQTNRFLHLVRQLNTAALAVKEHDTPENRQAIEDIQQSMQRLVERMPSVAGKTDSEVNEEAASMAPQNDTVDVANPTTTANGVAR